ncbi:MAG: hypothetical protein JNL60_06100, partial [Bacteroidia bacterium]|nr:hypothetical protein [Bacteroidia bacterium]
MKTSQPGNLSYKNLFVVLSLFISLTTMAVVKTSVSNGNWSKSSTWSPSGVPSSTDKIYIYHTVTLDQNFTTSDTIFVCSVLNFSNNKVLTLSPGIMVLVNNSQYNGRIGSMGSKSEIIGNYIFQKWVSRCDGFSTYGSPFDVQASEFNWYYCYRCMPSWSNIYFYDESKPGSLENGYYDSIPGTIKRGLGFYYWYSNYTGGMNFPRQISLKGSSDFSDDFVFPVTKTTSSVTSDDGYNLVSNPFPGTIDWLSTGWGKRKINDAIYTWNSCSGVYSSYVSGIGVNGGSRYISSMQGFWIQANHNNPLLTVNNEALVDDSRSLLRPSVNEPTKVLR